MMEKLTIEHLAPYLPYGLNVMYDDSIWIITGYDNMGCSFDLYKEDGFMKVDDELIKPILRPMSDKIKVNESKLPDEVGWVEPNDLFIDHQGRVSINMQLGGPTLSWDILSIQQYMQREFFSQHYDVFGLIDKGLAIDINTIQ